jgi:molybdenum cofactor cytidylyltransferase
MNTRSEIAAIILAGGQGKRIGQAKALHPLGGSTFLESILYNLRSAEILEQVIVVSRDLHDRVLAVSGEAKVVINPQADADMWSALQVGMREVVDIKGCMVIPVDHPFVLAMTYRQLADAFLSTPNSIIIPHYQNRGGHPVVLPFSWAKTIPELHIEGGLRTAIKQSGLPIYRLSVDDPGILRNINEKADLNS